MSDHKPQDQTLDQRMLDHFTCRRVDNAGGTPGYTLYFTKMGAHREYQLYRNEAAALHANLGSALGVTHSALSITEVTTCHECGSTALAWFTHNVIVTGVQQNRLNTSDVRCQFVLGCDECSETLKIISADKVAEWLNTRQGGAK